MTTETEERLLTRKELSTALTEAGFKTSTATLATFACRGCGPAYVSYGRTPLYRFSDAIAWAHARLAAPRKATFDVTAAHSA
jgi:hypothetical protein